MLVFWRERIVLLAVPKTGTTALEAALAPQSSLVLRHPPGLKHMALGRYRRAVLPLLVGAGPDLFETVAVVRHPVDWLGSWYRYRSRGAIVGQPKSTQGLGFDDFVRAYASPEPPPFAAVGSQARFVQGEAGAVGVTHLFRYEEPQRLLTFLEGRLGSPIHLSRVNVSPVLDVTLSPAVEAELRCARPDEFGVWEEAGT